MSDPPARYHPRQPAPSPLPCAAVSAPPSAVAFLSPFAPPFHDPEHAHPALAAPHHRDLRVVVAVAHNQTNPGFDSDGPAALIVQRKVQYWTSAFALFWASSSCVVRGGFFALYLGWPERRLRHSSLAAPHCCRPGGESVCAAVVWPENRGEPAMKRPAFCTVNSVKVSHNYRNVLLCDSMNE